MVWYWVGKRTEVLSASRKNGNRQPEELGGWGKAPECIRDLGGERLSGFNGRDLRGNALHWREETCKATSSRKTGHQFVRGCHLRVKILTHICFYLKELQKWKRRTT